MKNTRNNSLFRSWFFFYTKACLIINSVFMQSYNPTILGWDYLYGRGCRLACFVSESKRAFLLPCAITWLGILVKVVELEVLPIICNWLLQKIPYHTTMLFVCYPKILYEHCFQFLLGPFLLQRGTENYAQGNFGGDKQRALCYVMVFSVVVNYDSILEFAVTWMCPLATKAG